MKCTCCKLTKGEECFYVHKKTYKGKVTYNKRSICIKCISFKNLEYRNKIKLLNNSQYNNAA